MLSISEKCSTKLLITGDASFWGSTVKDVKRSQMTQTLLLQTQVKELLAQELYVSAEKLASFIVASSKRDRASGPGSHAVSLELYADALYGKREVQRALSYYKQATQRRKIGVVDGSSSGGRSSPSLGPGYATVTSMEEAELKFKECKCYVALDETPNVSISVGEERGKPAQQITDNVDGVQISHQLKAIRALESVPPVLRSLKANLLLGSVYMSTGTGSRRNAIRCYKDAISQCPAALEAIGPLVEVKRREPGRAGAPGARQVMARARSRCRRSWPAAHGAAKAEPETRAFLVFCFL